MSGSHNPWGMTQAQVLDWAGRGMRAAGQESELRRAVKAMSALLAGNEWAEHVSADEDAKALEQQITRLIGDKRPNVRCEPVTRQKES